MLTLTLPKIYKSSSLSENDLINYMKVSYMSYNLIEDYAYISNGVFLYAGGKIHGPYQNKALTRLESRIEDSELYPYCRNLLFTYYQPSDLNQDIRVLPLDFYGCSPQERWDRTFNLVDKNSTFLEGSTFNLKFYVCSPEGLMEKLIKHVGQHVSHIVSNLEYTISHRHPRPITLMVDRFATSELKYVEQVDRFACFDALFFNPQTGEKISDRCVYLPTYAHNPEHEHVLCLFNRNNEPTLTCTYP